MGNWPFAIRRDKRDEQITELEEKIATLQADLTAHDEESALALAALNEQIADFTVKALEAQRTLADRDETITALRLDISAGIERITELEHDAVEHAVASARYVEQIKKLHDDAQKWTEEGNRYTTELQTEIDDLLAFVRSLHKGDFRSNRHGPERYDEAVALLFKYDSEKKEQVMQGETKLTLKFLPLLDFDGISFCSVCGKNASSQCRGCKLWFCGQHFFEHMHDNAKFLDDK